MEPLQVPIMRELDRERIADLRDEHRPGEQSRFFWADLAAAGGPPPDEVAQCFGLSEGAAATLFDFAGHGPPRQRLHVEEELVVFAFWCSANPEPEADDARGAESLELLRVNVCLHGDFLLTVHERAFDLPAFIAPDGVSAGRSEHYAVFVVLEGMVLTLVDAIGSTELEIAELENVLLESGGHGVVHRAEVRRLRSRLTTLRMRIAGERGLFGRVREEIEQIPSLEPDREAYFDRITGELDRAVDRIDAASSALSHMLDAQLNETTFRLSVIATIFLPLTFLTGFFGMNFGWLVDNIDSPLAFWLLGVGLMTGPLILVGALLRGGALAERFQKLGQSLIGRS